MGPYCKKVLPKFHTQWCMKIINKYNNSLINKIIILIIIMIIMWRVHLQANSSENHYIRIHISSVLNIAKTFWWYRIDHGNPDIRTHIAGNYHMFFGCWSSGRDASVLMSQHDFFSPPARPTSITAWRTGNSCWSFQNSSELRHQTNMCDLSIIPRRLQVFLLYLAPGFAPWPWAGVFHTESEKAREIGETDTNWQVDLSAMWFAWWPFRMAHSHQWL